MWKRETQFCALLDYPCGPNEIVEIMPMSYDGETGSDTPRLHWAVQLHYCAQVDQSIGKYSMGHDTGAEDLS